MQNNMKEEFRNNWLDNQRNIERLENNVMSLEERVESKFKSQAKQHSSGLQEMESRLSQRSREQTCKLKDYIDNTMSKRIVGVKDM